MQNVKNWQKRCERAFGVLKSQFAIICGPPRNWYIDTMKNIILACIILHNMIVEDDWDTHNDNINVDYDHIDQEISNVDVSCGALPRLCYIPTNKALYAYKRNSSITSSNLMEHIWTCFNDNNDKI